MVQQLDELISIRRTIHRQPEIGWTEFQTSAFVAKYLGDLGFNVRMGKEVLSEGDRLGLPSQEVIHTAFLAALDNMTDANVMEKMKGGMTGVVATLGEGKPVTAFRFDLDALPIQEAQMSEHRPYKDGFSSEVIGVHHACGHDGHTAIGMTLGKFLAANRSAWQGTVKLIFQPAEEGCRGAQAMVKAGVVDNVDQLICLHLGLIAGTGTLVAGAKNFLASKKYEVVFSGRSAHAGLSPETGRNALLACATAALHLHAIERHSKAATRVNVGRLSAGGPVNVIPDSAILGFEIRSSSSEGLEFLDARAHEIIAGAATSYGVSVETSLQGLAETTTSDDQLVQSVIKCARSIGVFEKVLPEGDIGASEDATLFMKEVQGRGGVATYIVVGSESHGGHHTNLFDIDEVSLSMASDLLKKLVTEITVKAH